MSVVGSRREAARPTVPAAQPREVGDGIFCYVQGDGRWWVNTTGFVVAEDGVVVIDACATGARTRAFRAALGTVTDRAVRMLINTHAHGDHTYGNAVFADVPIVAQRGCRVAVLADQFRGLAGRWWSPVPDWHDLPVTPPSVTFDRQLTVWAGDRQVELHHFGVPAHTDHDVVCVAGDGVVFVGDLIFNGGTPMFLSGSVAGYLQAVQQLRSLAPRLLVPGHGGPCGPGELDEHEAYARFVLTHAEKGIAAGLEPLEVAHDIDLGRFADRSDAERIVLNLHRAYADLQPDRALDIARAFDDTVAYHGGLLPTHA